MSDGCEHVVGVDDDYDNGITILTIEYDDYRFIGVEEEYNFCPLCGISLKDFWEKFHKES